MIARAEAVGWRCSNSPFCLSISGVHFPRPTQFRTIIYGFGLRYVVDWSSLDYLSVYVAGQRSAEVNWTACDKDERLIL